MKRQTTHRLFGALLLSTSVTTALTLTTGAAGADTCTDITFDGPTLDEPNAGYTLPVNVTIPAGVVVLVPEAVSTDEGDGRAAAPAQTSERWDLEFLDGSNGVAGRSGVTEDLADGIESATWTGELNGAFVVSPVVAVRARHRPDLGDRTTNDDVTAVSVTLCWGEPATTTTTSTSTSTTEAPTSTTSTTSTTEAPTSTTPSTTSTTSTTVAPTSTTSTTSTTVATTSTTVAPTTTRAITTTTRATVAGTSTNRSLAVTGGSSTRLFVLGGLTIASGLGALALRRRLD